MSHPFPASKRKTSSRSAMLADDSSPRVLRPAPLRQAVYDAIIELIVQGTLERGRHLVEAELAEYLGVSRQPVREALQRLQADGWIELRPAQGAFVHIPSEEEVDQLLAVRTVLETHSAGLAASHATPEDVNRLWELQQDGLNALAANDSEGLVQANAALHAAITTLAGNKVLAEHIGLVERKWRWYYLPIAQPRGQDAWSEHAELITAIAAGDVARATDIMHRHTERTREVYHTERLAKAEQD